MSTPPTAAGSSSPSSPASPSMPSASAASLLVSVKDLVGTYTGPLFSPGPESEMPSSGTVAPQLMKMKWNMEDAMYFSGNSHYADVLSYYITEEEVLPIDALPYFPDIQIAHTPTKLIYTSPNVATFMPEIPLGAHTVRTFNNGRFGLFDRTLHPQWCAKGYEMAVFNPRFTTDLPDVLKPLWYDIQEADCPTVKGNAVAIDIRVCRKELIVALFKAKNYVIGQAEGVLANNPKATYIHRYIHTLNDHFTTFSKFGISKQSLIDTITDFQRNAITLLGVVNYYTKFQARYNDPSVKHPVDLTIMGGITADFRVAEYLFRLGVPVFFVRPWTNFFPEAVKIYKYGEKRQLVRTAQAVHTDRVPPSPTLYHGFPGPDMYLTMNRLGHSIWDDTVVSARAWELLRKPLPSSLSSSLPAPSAPHNHVTVFALPPGSTLPPASVPSLPSPAVSVLSKSSVVASKLQTKKPHKKVPKVQASGNTLPPPYPGCSYVDLARMETYNPEPSPEDRRPFASPLWLQAIHNIDRSAGVTLPEEHPMGGTYVPPSSVFTSTTSPRTLVTYVVTWVATRQFYIGFIVNGGNPGIVKIQHWRNFLSRSGHLIPTSVMKLLDPSFVERRVMDASSSQPNAHGKRAAGEASGRKRKMMRSLEDNEMLSSITLLSTVKEVRWAGNVLKLDDGNAMRTVASPPVLSQILYELETCNSRIDMLVLDQALAPHKWPRRDSATMPSTATPVVDSPPDAEDRALDSGVTLLRLQRRQEIEKIFPPRIDGRPEAFLITEIPHENLGLASLMVQGRRQALQAMQNVVKDWEGAPALVVEYDGGWADEKLIALEAAMVPFYCQSFYDCFGRAPVPPPRIPWYAMQQSHPISLLDTPES